MIEHEEERILAFLRGDCSSEERDALLTRIEQDSDFAADFRAVARGFETASSWAETQRPHASTPPGPNTARTGRLVPAWWVPLAAAASIAVAVPLTATLSGAAETAPSVPVSIGELPAQPEPSFVVVLQGRWPDAAELAVDERSRRAGEYWQWASDLAAEGRLVAAGDLEWEPGLQVASGGEPVEAPAGVVAEPDFLVGMFTIRAGSYEEALAIAQECPHLRFGGSVSVRRVGRGFVTVAGMSDLAG